MLTISYSGNLRTSRLRTLFLLLATSLLLAAPVLAEDPLQDGFRQPPHEAWPSAYWLWLNGYVNRDHVERELSELRAAGIRGVCIFDMGARGDKSGMPPAGPPFMSERSVDDIDHAVRAAQRLGLDVQLSVASSWDMGGTWVQPQHASMALFHTQTTIVGPQSVDQSLPFPELSAKAPRDENGEPAFYRDVAVLAIPAEQRLPGHDFIFQLDPPGLHCLSHAVLCNTPSDDSKTHGPLQLFAKEFSIAVSETLPEDAAFQQVFRGTMEPNAEPQRFELPEVAARFVRLRIVNGHNPRFDRVQLGEFELYDTDGVNTVASHAADRSRDGAVLLGYRSAWGHDKVWTAENIHDGSRSGAGGSWSSAGLPPFRIPRLESVIDLSDRVDAQGRLRWQAPAGRWEILRFVCANTGERLKVPSPNSDGLATDHFSGEATQAFLETLIERLQQKLGPLEQTALKQLYLASYEVRGRIWTPDLLRQFAEYRGYEMNRYLPALIGNVVVDDQITARFIYDYRKTLGDLLVDAYYRTAVDTAHAAGLGVESEAGGPGPPIHQVPVDALQALGVLDEVRGEFWPKRPAADRLWVVKETACAAHIYGKSRVHMEAFTSMHHWQDGPIDLKPSADRAFCEGANHFVWHTSSHVPPEAGQPGWMYLAGTHINPNIVWWKQARPFLEYLSRCSYLLQQGQFVADVCYYYGDQGYNFVPPRHTDPLPALGYDFDVTNRDVLLNRMQVHKGRVALPHGMSYALLVLPDREDIDLDVLKRVEQLVRAGATVVGPKPKRSSGLSGYPQRDQQVQIIADRVWGHIDSSTAGERACGAGRIVWGQTPQEVLASAGVTPDFQCSGAGPEPALDFIHRRTADSDIYFVRNSGPSWVHADVTFRVEGRVPEIWDPASASVRPQFEYRKTSGGVQIPLGLPPYGSTFVVFRCEDPERVPMRLVFQSDSRDGPSSVTAATAPEIHAWDGRQAEVLALQSGTYRVSCEEGRTASEVVESLAAQELNGPWEVQFTDPWGESFERVLDQLVSWPDHQDDAVRYFSGHARYCQSFDIPVDWMGPGRQVRLELGRLGAVAEVAVNGQRLGVHWKPPFTLDITQALRPGSNELVVVVANTWSNRLVGDAQMPADQRKTRTNVPSSGGKPWKDVPLLESGLLGPVRLLPGKVIRISLRDE